MIAEPVESNTECRVLGVNSLSKRTLSALGARDGHLRLATRYMHKMAFWNIFDGVNRHSSCGDRVAKVTASQPSYRRLLGEEATSTIENDKDVGNVRQCIAARLPTKCPNRKHPESGQVPRLPNVQVTISMQLHSSQAVLYSSKMSPFWSVYFTGASGLTKCLEQ